MICASCGVEVDDTHILCPHCGQALQKRAPVQPPPQPEVHRELVPVRPMQVTPYPVEQPKAHRRTVGLSPWVWLLLLVMLISCVGLAFVAAGVGGVYQGLKERDRLNQVASQQHYTRGLEHLQLQERELAQAEFEEALRLDPRFLEAYERLKEVRIKATAQPTPTSAVVEQAVDEIFVEAQAAIANDQLDEAIAKLEQVKSLDPAFQAQTVSDLLYQSYTKKANTLLEANSLEEARRSLDLALALNPDDSEASAQSQLIDEYITASGLLGANWDEALTRLTELHDAHPGFLDVAGRLYQAHVDYGDWLAQKESWCDAADQYAQAVAMQANAKVQERQVEMTDSCRTNPPTATPVGGADGADATAVAVNATSAAEVVAVPTPRASRTPGPTAEAAAAASPEPGGDVEKPAATAKPVEKPEVAPQPAGSVSTAGTLIYSAWDEDQVHRIYSVKASGGNPEIVMKDASQPAFNRNGANFAYHSWAPDTNGLCIVDDGGRNGNRITKFAEDGFPTWSPDGTQLAFASTRESDRRTRIFTTWSGGLADGQALILGDSPAWSAKGPIAYHGCDTRGGNCGIWSISPDGGGQNQLTSHESDNAPAWTADGAALAFMSARDGNWEIYRCGADGSSPTRLTSNGANDGLPTWSPDGTTIAFVSDAGGGWGLYAVPASGGEATKLADIPNIGREWMQQRLSWRP